MKRFLLLLALMLIVNAQAQPFQFVQEWDSVKIDVGGRTLPAAWWGGYSQSSPFFVDIDGDNDFDIVIGGGKWESLDLWQNDGTASQENYRINLNGLQTIENVAGTSPEFVDIDADGDLDLILSIIMNGSRLQVYTNIGSITSPYFQLTEDTLRDTQGNMIYGTRHDLADIDGDGDYDLFVGEWYTGRIHFYRNIGGPTNYAFQLQDSFFAGIQVGYWSSPEFCDIDGDGDLDMFIGDDYGHVWFYRNNGTPQLYNFILVSNNWLNIFVGDRADPQFCDIDGDSDYDLFLGKDNDTNIIPPGDIHFWRNHGTQQAPQLEQENQMYLTFDLGRDLGDPEFVDVNQDGKMDMYLFYYYLGWMKNIGTYISPRFQMMSYSLLQTPYTNYIGGAGFGDLNSDGHEDLIITHAWSGVVDFWLSNGDTVNPGFNFVYSVDYGEFHGSPAFGDLDGDGDKDMLIPGTPDFITGGLRYFQNQGTPQHFNFVCVDSDYQDLQAGEPVLIDFDGDGDLDLLGGLSYPDSRIKYFQNEGTPQQANMVLITEDLMGIPCPTLGMPDFFDIDGDGDMDAIGGTSAGGLLFFRNVTDTTAVPLPGTAPARPCKTTLSIGPNPANPITAISYKLQAASVVNLAVYDIAGRKVATLVSGKLSAGEHNITWDATGNASGVYLIQLLTPQEAVVRKVVVVK